MASKMEILSNGQ